MFERVGSMRNQGSFSYCSQTRSQYVRAANQYQINEANRIYETTRICGRQINVPSQSILIARGTVTNAEGLIHLLVAYFYLASIAVRSDKRADTFYFKNKITFELVCIEKIEGARRSSCVILQNRLFKRTGLSYMQFLKH
jgi:hypothetical protein